MVWLKACPKCQGDLFLDQDHYGKFKTCVQCGYLREVIEASVQAAQTPPTASGTDGALLGLMAATPGGA